MPSLQLHRRLPLLLLLTAVYAASGHPTTSRDPSSSNLDEPAPDRVCTICLTEHDPLITPLYQCRQACRQPTCLEMLRQEIRARIANRQLHISCPGCKASLKDHSPDLDHGVLADLVQNPDLFAKWERWHLESTQTIGGRAFRCPSVNCPNLVWSDRPLSDFEFLSGTSSDSDDDYEVDESGKDRRRWFCTACSRAYCVVCGEAWLAGPHAHDQLSCDAFGAVARTPAERRTLSTLENDSERCPDCNQWIYKDQGCAHLICTHCGREFSSVARPSWTAIWKAVGDLVSGISANIWN